MSAGTVIWINAVVSGLAHDAYTRWAMHDVVGSAGMIHGWIDIWTGHLLWLLAVMTVSVGVAALFELLLSTNTLYRITRSKTSA